MALRKQRCIKQIRFLYLYEISGRTLPNGLNVVTWHLVSIVPIVVQNTGHLL